MLGKLMKYDFKWINKALIVYYILLFIATAGVVIVENMEQTFFLLIVDKILSGYLIGCSISAFITCLLRIWVRYNASFYKDESYLTHTLPVTKNELYNSKIITSVLSLIITLVFIGLCYLATYVLVSPGSLTDLYNSVVSMIGKTNTNLFIVSGLLLITLEALFIMLAGIFGLTIGNRANNSKILKSITFGFASYFGFNLITLLVYKLLDIFTSFDLASKAAPSIEIMKMLGIVGIAAYLIYNLLYYLVSKKIFNNGVNVE